MHKIVFFFVSTFILISINSNTYAQNDTILYSFFIAGHTYGNPGVNNIGFHPPFKDKFEYIRNRTEIKFGVLTGDIVSPNPIAQDWDEIDADLEELGLPVYFAVGNHDMENRPLFEERYGITYYYFNYKNDLFIVLDPIMNEWNIEGNQLQLLQDLLENQVPNSDNVFIFFHQILWKESHNQFNYIKWNSAAGRGDSVNFWKDVEPMFRFLPNEVYMFAGDLGASWASDVSYDKYDNITLCSSGMGHPDGENFIVVNVHNNKEVSYDLICLSDPNMDCLGELKDHLVVSELLDVNDPIDSNTTNISIHPNPVKNYITINLKQPHNTNIQIFNTQGSLIYEQYYFNQYQFSIDISLLPKGLYFVKSSYLSNIEAVKVIKE